jgi:integrase/recombinase XerC
MTAKQMEIAIALGISETKARSLRVKNLFDGDKFIGPNGAEAIARKYMQWRQGRVKKTERVDPDSFFLVRQSRLRWEGNYLTRADIKKLLRVMKEQSGKLNALRDRFLVLFLYRTALRIHEGNRLNVGDLVIDERLEVRDQLLFLGKGGLSRKIPLVLDTKREIKKYLVWKKKNGENMDLEAPLFTSRFNCRLSIRQMQQTISNWVALAGIPKITAHGLRHTALTHVCHGSPKGVLVAQRLAGHASLSTTQRYLHLSPEDYSSALEGLV